MNYEYKLSIIALVYNLEKYLPRCLEALVNQTLNNIEILCVDDGSTDSAPQIIDEFQKKYPDKIKVFHKENGGEFTTRNYGLERAKGEYITFVDTDDYVELDWAEKLYNAAKKSNADMAVCGFERIDLETNKVVAKNMTKFGNTTKIVNSKDDFVSFINPAPWNKIYKRELIKDFRFLPFRGFNDTMFLITSFINIKTIAFVPDVLYHYYLRYDSQIHTVNIKDVENLKKYLLKVKDTYIEYKKYEEFKYILDLMAFIHLGVSVMYRVSYDKTIDIKQELNKTIEYLDENFSTWRNSPFLKFGYSIKKGIKHIGLWLISKIYKINKPIIYIKIYRFLVDKIKVDIKF
ncbi:MAG: glycosyltransferase [Clostridiaceae bacterium]|nr:glycosyltransferase [Clostridiaceae bacterium]